MTRSRDLANLADSTEFTSADHTKLDGIETAATADQTNAEIKTAVEAGADIALGGNPTTTTQSAGNNSTRIATTAYTDVAIAALVDSAPSTLNTLAELSSALGSDANFSTTVTNSIATKLPLAGGTVTGDVTFNTQIGLGAAPHATAPLNITTTNQHIRLNNGSELGVISVLSGGELDIWGNGDGESINFRTGSGSGSVAMSVVGDNLSIGHASPTAPLDIRISGASGRIAEFHNTSGFGVDIGSDSDAVTYISGGYTQALAFKTNAGSGQVERMRIENSGTIKFGPDAQDIQLLPASTNSGVNRLYLRGNASNDKSTITLNHYGVRAFYMGSGIIGSGLFHIGTSDSNAGLVMDGNSNVLVGKAVTTQNTAGTQISATSGVRATVDQNVASILNRTTNDGDIVSFRKDGSAVGSIGSDGPNLFINLSEDNNVGISAGVSSSVPVIFPTSKTGSVRNGEVHLGYDSGRFKDLYLSQDILFKGRIYAQDIGASGIAMESKASGAHTYTAYQFKNSSNVQVGSIAVATSSTAYNTSSDYRLKENVNYTWDATTRLKQLKPARFNFIADADTTVDGFLAHEAQAVVPECVSGTKDEVDDNGDAVMQGIDQSKLVPLLVKTIIELEARITALEG